MFTIILRDKYDIIVIVKYYVIGLEPIKLWVVGSCSEFVKWKLIVGYYYMK